MAENIKFTIEHLSKSFERKEVLRDIDFTFEKGAGKKVDQCGKKFVLKYGMDKLNEVAKIHFKNTEKILDLINK